MNQQELTQALESLRQEVHRLTADLRALQHPQGRVFVATRDSNAGAFTEQIPLADASDLQDLDSSTARSALDADTGLTLINLPPGVVPVLQYINGDNNAYVVLSVLCNIPVIVSLAAGSNGNQTTAATWTYDVTDVASNPIASALAPSWQRAKGKKVAATHGFGYYDPTGTFVLESVDEVDDTGHC